MNKPFTSVIKQFEIKVKKRLRVTAREAVQQTVEIAQHPAREGGRMRIKTGFLRASIQAALGTMPKGPTTGQKGVKDDHYREQVAGSPVGAVLLQWEPGVMPIYVGWTANYARIREYRDGFLRGAVQQWDRSVARAAKKAKAVIR
jgi:hypothetical protein